MRARTWRLYVSLLLLIITGMMPLASTIKAGADASIAPWLVSSLPSLDKISDLSPSEVAAAVISINIDCQPREIITRPARLIPYVQTQQSSPGCVTDTAYGAVSNGQYLQRQGSTVYGTVTTNAGGTATLIPIPYSSTGLVMSGGSRSGSYLWFIKNLDTKLDSSAIVTGESTHKLPAPYTSSLHDGSGRLLATQADTISFSSNGAWMVVDLPGIGTARVNAETYEVLPFGDAVNYDIGIGPAIRTAISPDGRFATVASKNFNIFKLYDLSTCGPVPSIITGKANCGSRDLLPFVKSKVAGFSSIFRMRFRSDYTLDMYINSTQNGALVTSHQVMLAADQTATNFDYLALGDSFASGEGAYQYKAITDTAENKCHLSQRSYPYLISNNLNYGQYESVACSGANIDDVLKTSEEYIGKHTQAKGKESTDYDEDIYGGFLPGYRAQKNFVSKYNPNIITLSNGGNDVGFDDKIKRCIDSDTCYSSYEDRLEIVNEINGQFYRLTDMYNQLKTGIDPHAKLYVIGYPQIAQPGGNCALNVHLNNDEIIFSQQLIGYINSVIKTAAANAGGFYVDVEAAFAGHKMCETDSWNVAVNGLTNGNDAVNLPLVHGPVGNESFHPNAFGHELFKIKILEQTNNFTAVMPAPNPSAVIKDVPAALPILQAPKSNRAIRLIRNVTGTNEGVLHYGQTWVQNYSSVAPFIKTGSQVQVWINSDPAYLGAFSVDAAGNLTISATVPDSVPPGFHTLHIYGKNTIGEDVDLYQTVYVAANDANPACLVGLSGIDTDKDNIDDACDPIIGQPPAVILPAAPNPVPPAPPTVSPPPITTIPPVEPTPISITPPVLPPAPDPVILPPFTSPQPTNLPTPPLDNPPLPPAAIIPPTTTGPTSPTTIPAPSSSNPEISTNIAASAPAQPNSSVPHTNANSSITSSAYSEPMVSPTGSQTTAAPQVAGDTTQTAPKVAASLSKTPAAASHKTAHNAWLIIMAGGLLAITLIAYLVKLLL